MDEKWIGRGFLVLSQVDIMKSEVDAIVNAANNRL